MQSVGHHFWWETEHIYTHKEKLTRKSWGKILCENLVRKSCGKFLWENLEGKSCMKILWENLVRKSCTKLLLENLAGKSCGKILWESLAGKSCGKILPEILLGKCCRKFWCQNPVGISCRIFLWENLAGKSYEKILRENLAVNSCGKILWGNMGENLVGKSWRKILSENLAGKSCGKILRENLAGNVTGPPGALLFNRDQRLHWNNHFNCCFVRVATFGIYCTDFLPKMLIQVKYPMQSVGHHFWWETEHIFETVATFCCQILTHSTDIETIRLETEQHFQRRYASTELQCIEWLALEIMKEYAILLGMTQGKLIIEPETWNLTWNAVNVWYLSHCL